MRVNESTDGIVMLVSLPRIFAVDGSRELLEMIFGFAEDVSGFVRNRNFGPGRLWRVVVVAWPFRRSLISFWRIRVLDCSWGVASALVLRSRAAIKDRGRTDKQQRSRTFQKYPYVLPFYAAKRTTDGLALQTE